MQAITTVDQLNIKMLREIMCTIYNNLKIMTTLVHFNKNETANKALIALSQSANSVVNAAYYILYAPWYWIVTAV